MCVYCLSSYLVLPSFPTLTLPSFSLSPSLFLPPFLSLSSLSPFPFSLSLPPPLFSLPLSTHVTGVTMWEVLTFGAKPYGKKKAQEVLTLIEKGERLPQPATCSDILFNHLLKCEFHIVLLLNTPSRSGKSYPDVCPCRIFHCQEYHEHGGYFSRGKIFMDDRNLDFSW